MSGDAPDERAEAMWSLAQQVGKSAIAGQFDREPHPGVRRALCVVLAGHGEGERVLEAARSDVDPFVRGTAIQLATRLAAGGALPVPAVLDAIAREPALAESALGAIAEGAPAPLIAFTRAQLASPLRPVQLEAFEALLRASLRDEARAWMVAQADLADVCRRWLRLASADTLASAFAGQARDVRVRVLRVMHDAPWSAAAVLVGDDRDLLADLARNRGDVPIPAAVLARAIIAGTHAGCVLRLTQQLRDAGAGLALLGDIKQAVARVNLKALRDLTQRARAHARALEIDGALAVLDQLVEAHPVDHLIGLEHALTRWLDHGNAPADLLPLVPDLRAYLAKRLAEPEPVEDDGVEQWITLAGTITRVDRGEMEALVEELEELR